MRDEKRTTAWVDAGDIFIDDRGWLMAVAQNFKDWPFKPARMYIVSNFDTTIIRGMHHHKREWKSFIVVGGSVLFGWIKEGEYTTGEASMEYRAVSARKPAVFFVAPQTWHGWRALELNSIMLGFSNFTLEETGKDDQRQPVPFGAFQVKNR